MNKLIKLSETYYIAVDNSEKKEGDWVRCGVIIGTYKRDPINDTHDIICKGKCYPFSLESDLQKITHSTEPLSKECKYCTGYCKQCVDGTKPLSLSEIEEAIKNNPSENNEWNAYFDENGKMLIMNV